MWLKRNQETIISSVYNLLLIGQIELANLIIFLCVKMFSHARFIIFYSPL